jgi:hypothetical protein
MSSEDHRCPNCDTTIRATGGAEALYETDAEHNKVVSHDLRAFDGDADREKKIGYLHYCPNESCPVWRLFPLDWEATDDG